MLCREPFSQNLLTDEFEVGPNVRGHSLKYDVEELFGLDKTLVLDDIGMLRRSWMDKKDA